MGFFTSMFLFSVVITHRVGAGVSGYSRSLTQGLCLLVYGGVDLYELFIRLSSGICSGHHRVVPISFYRCARDYCVWGSLLWLSARSVVACCSVLIW